MAGAETAVAVTQQSVRRRGAVEIPLAEWLAEEVARMARFFAWYKSRKEIQSWPDEMSRGEWNEHYVFWEEDHDAEP